MVIGYTNQRWEESRGKNRGDDKSTKGIEAKNNEGERNVSSQRRGRREGGEKCQ
jgi:hypothetical protein